MTSASLAIEQIVDLESYPIDRPGLAEYQALLERGREALERSALFALPHFLRPGIAPRMAAELERLLPLSTRYERRRIVALFCYDRNPGTTFDQWYIEELEQGLPTHVR